MQTCLQCKHKIKKFKNSFAAVLTSKAWKNGVFAITLEDIAEFKKNVEKCKICLTNSKVFFTLCTI
jgi:hypothetical protein